MHSKIEGIETQLDPDQQALLVQAATIQGQSLSEFVIHSAYQVAQQVVQEKEILSLTALDREFFVQSLLEDREIPPRLERAAIRYIKTMQKG